MVECIAILLDKSFIVGFEALINSLSKHTPNLNLPIVCYSVNLDNTDKEKCKQIYNNINFENINFINYSKLPTHSKNLTNSFYKLEMFDLATRMNGVLYLDCDIIFTDSIMPLLDKHVFQDPVAIRYHEQYGEHNTGVMIFNHKISRQYYSKLINLMKAMSVAHLGDQAVIKRAYVKNILPIDRLNAIWNTTKREVIKSEYNRYKSIHYVGKKPWQGGEGNEYAEVEQLWWQYYNKDWIVDNEINHSGNGAI